jgi:hypothetical protein
VFPARYELNSYIYNLQEISLERVNVAENTFNILVRLTALSISEST